MQPTTMPNRSVQVKVRIQVGFVLAFILGSLMVHPLCQTSTVPAKEQLCRYGGGNSLLVLCFILEMECRYHRELIING